MRAGLLAFALAATSGACHGKPSGDAGKPPETVTTASAASAVEEGGPQNTTSLYALSVTLVDQDGAKCGFDVFGGRPVIVGMFYSRCPSACPC